ncbi:MAG: DNA-3-methyladenine glycosylase [Actinomycetota bacterium]|nr:DNA-3-methyladenine glycosylase [Actinomycetota bacterium]
MDFFKEIKRKIFDKNNILGRDFYSRDTATVAGELLGKLLITGNKESFCGGFIVEDEAYYGLNDPASHACNGATPRSKIMFDIPGIAYVYFCYGNHYLLNVVTEKPEVPGAVLIRAAEPVFGIKKMIERRQIKNENILAKGPGNLTKAFGIDRNFNGKNMTDLRDEIFITDFDVSDFQTDADMNKEIIKIFEKYSVIKAISSSSRVGIKKGTESMLRFYIKGNRFVSGKHD